jgi:hypothetical protein
LSLDGREHEKDPRLPSGIPGNATERAVIAGFVLDEVATVGGDAAFKNRLGLPINLGLKEREIIVGVAGIEVHVALGLMP